MRDKLHFNVSSSPPSRLLKFISNSYQTHVKLMSNSCEDGFKLNLSCLYHGYILTLSERKAADEMNNRETSKKGVNINIF